MDGRCDCGDVSISIPHWPDEINACPCGWCRRVDGFWGYFPVGPVTVTGTTRPYRRASRTLEFHRCATCGVLTHWIEPTGRAAKMGVQMRNFDLDAVRAIAVVARG